jgi:signal transduction histidine kinase
MYLGVLAHADPVDAFVGKMIFAALGALLTLALRPLYRWLYDRGLSIPRFAVVGAVCSYLLSLGWSAAYHTATTAYRAWQAGEAFAVPSGGALISGALFYSFIILAWSMLYVGAKYYLDLQAQRERALAAESLAHQAQLQALRYQLNPHFLFNTLNAISTLIVERQHRDAERMVARLSDFLRLTLESSSAAEIPLAEELAFVRQYLEIQQVRFGERLQVAYDVDAEALSACVPPLLLQPLVENAVRHGITSREEGGRLTLDARRVGGHLHLRVADDGPGPPDAATMTASDGVGLSNVQARLQALYGDDARFQMERADGGGCVVSITLPFHTDPQAPSTEPTLSASSTPALTHTTRR